MCYSAFFGSYFSIFVLDDEIVLLALTIKWFSVARGCD